MCFYVLLQYGHGQGSKIYLSGPLLNSSRDVDQMLKKHDREIQEFYRRTRLDKTRVETVAPHGKQVAAK